MRAAVLVVLAWAVVNLVLTALMFVFRPAPIEYVLHVVASVLVAAFGVLLFVAVRTDRGTGPQTRQPRRAGAAAMLGIGTVVGLTAFAVGWWMAVFAVFPLGAAAWLLRGERLGAGARPWPAVPEDAVPVTGRAPRTHDGSGPGVAVAVPGTHPGHGPPHRTTASGPARVAALLLAGLLRRRRHR